MGFNLNEVKTPTGWQKAHVKAAYEKTSSTGKPGYLIEFWIHEQKQSIRTWISRDYMGLRKLKQIAEACGIGHDELNNFDISMIIQKEVKVKIELRGKYLEPVGFEAIANIEQNEAPQQEVSSEPAMPWEK